MAQCEWPLVSLACGSDLQTCPELVERIAMACGEVDGSVDEVVRELAHPDLHTRTESDIVGQAAAGCLTWTSCRSGLQIAIDRDESVAPRDAAKLFRTIGQVVICALSLASVQPGLAGGERALEVGSDSRGDITGLPAGITPWWPSRYGADDQLGTLNEITPAVVLNAVRLVKRGEVLDLGRVLDENTPKFPGRYWHQTVDASAPYTNLRRADTVGKGWGENEINWITEIQAGTFQVGTQLDSIGHIQIGDRFYNGWTNRDVVESWGINRFGMETVPPITTRGVLVDVAAYKNVERLASGYVITLADVRGALAKQGVEVQTGDAVLFHTGWGGLWGQDNEAFLSGEPGPGMEVVEWLYSQHIALTGADTWSYGPVPGEDAKRPFLVPQTMYVKMGLFGLENLATEELASREVYEFLFVITHHKTRGSTAAIIAPAAVY